MVREIKESDLKTPKAKVPTTVTNLSAIAMQALGLFSPNAAPLPTFQKPAAEVTTSTTLLNQFDKSTVPNQSIDLARVSGGMYVEGALTDPSKVEQGVNFDLESSPRRKLIEYAFAINKSLNEYKPPAGVTASKEQGLSFISYLSKNLNALGFNDVLEGDQASSVVNTLIQSYKNPGSQKIQSYNLNGLLSLARDNYLGAPLLETSVDLKSTTDILLTTSNQGLSPAGGEVIRFQNDWADITGLKGGDTFYLKYPQSQGKPESNHTGVILATSQLTETSEPVVLVAHANRFVNEQGLLVKDGQMRIEWMNQTRFDEQFKEKGSQMAVERPFGMGKRWDLPNYPWLNGYEISMETIAQGRKFDGVPNVVEWLAQVTALARNPEERGVGESETEFIESQLQRGLLNPLDTSHFAVYEQMRSQVNPESTGISSLPGMAEAKLSLEILKNHGYSYVPSELELSDLDQRMKNLNLTFDQFLATKDSFRLQTGVEWFNSPSTASLKIGDLVITPGIGEGTSATVGVVLKEHSDASGKRDGASIMFFNYQGNGEITLLDTFNSDFNENYPSFGVLRHNEKQNSSWLSDYQISDAVVREYGAFFNPDSQYQVIGQILEASRSQPTIEKRNEFISSELRRMASREEINQSILDRWIELSSIVSNNQQEIDGSPFIAPGFAEVFLGNSITQINRNILYGVKPDTMLDFATDLQNHSHTMSEALDYPENIETHGYRWLTTSRIEDLNQNDIIFAQSSDESIPTSVGIVINSSYQNGKNHIELIMYNQDGTGSLVQFHADSWSSFIDTTGHIYRKFGVLRTPESDNAQKITHEAMLHIKSSSEIPPQIKSLVLGGSINFEEIPVVMDLRHQLENAQTPQERSKILFEMSSVLGVQTLDGVEYDFDDPSYVWNSSNKAKCNLYSVEWMRMVGLGKNIAHRERGGKPTDVGGTELSASGMYEFMNRHGEANGWTAVDNLSDSQKLELLKRGYVFYGANGGHTWVIYGYTDSQGNTYPVMTQATDNFLSAYPNGAHKFSDPSPRNKGDKVLWAIPLPGVEPFDFSEYEKLDPSIKHLIDK